MLAKHLARDVAFARSPPVLTAALSRSFGAKKRESSCLRLSRCERDVSETGRLGERWSVNDESVSGIRVIVKLVPHASVGQESLEVSGVSDRGDTIQDSVVCVHWPIEGRHALD